MTNIAKILQIRPGRVAALFPQALGENESDTTAVTSIRDGICFAQLNGAQFVQSLVHPDDERAVRWLESCGFSYISDVLYLVCRQSEARAADENDGLQFLGFDESSEMQNRLSGLILRTYEGSLDCPQLNGLRSMEDVLASYRAVGRYHPQRWIVVQSESADVGCILLADHPDESEWEIVYMGILPQFRGQGFGLKLVRWVQALARNGEVERVSLAVDARNQPALAIYRASGFEMAVKHRLFLHRI